MYIGFGGAGMLLAAAALLAGPLSREVLLIAPHDPAVVKLNQSLYVPGEPVADLYGNALSEPVRIVLPAGDKMVRPLEDTSLLLLPVDKSAGENPLQARTVWLFARYLGAGFLALGLVGLVLPRRAVPMVSAA